MQSLQPARGPPAGVLRTGSGSAKARNWTALRKPTAHPLRPGQVVPTGGPRGGAPVHPEADCASGWAPGQGASTQAMTEPKATGPPWSRQRRLGCGTLSAVSAAVTVNTLLVGGKGRESSGCSLPSHTRADPAGPLARAQTQAGGTGGSMPSPSPAAQCTPSSFHWRK